MATGTALCPTPLPTLLAHAPQIREVIAQTIADAEDLDDALQHQPLPTPSVIAAQAAIQIGPARPPATWAHTIFYAILGGYQRSSGEQ